MAQDTHEALAAEVRAFGGGATPLGLFGGKRPKADGVRGDFCRVWPAAREALAMLQALVPASVRMVIAIVVSAGDAAAGGVCKASPQE